MHHWAHKVFSHVVLQQCEDLAQAGGQRGQKGCPPVLETVLSITRVTNYYNFSNTANYHHAINVNTKADKTGFQVII